MRRRILIGATSIAAAALCLAGSAPAMAAPAVTIGDFVWYDADGNGVQDAGEPGLGGVTVRLIAADDTTVVSTTTTDASGNYAFSIDPDLLYSVEFDASTANVAPLAVPYGVQSAAELTPTRGDGVVANGATEQTDSDPELFGNGAPVDLTTTLANDSSIDAGFEAQRAFIIHTVVVGSTDTNARFRILLTCEDVYGAPDNSGEILTADGTIASLVALNAGAVCDVSVVSNYGAVTTTYSVDGGAPSTTPISNLALANSRTDVTVTFDFTPAAVTPPALAATGVDDAWLLPVGAVVLLGGIALLRRRRLA